MKFYYLYKYKQKNKHKNFFISLKNLNSGKPLPTYTTSDFEIHFLVDGKYGENMANTIAVPKMKGLL